VADSTAANAPKPRLLPLPKPLRWLRDALGTLLWATLLTQWFIFDVGGALLRVAPWLEFVYRFRSLVLLGVAVLLVLTYPYKRAFFFFTAIVLFPLGLLFRLIIALCKNWPIAVIFSPAIHSFVTTFRLSFTLWALAITACVVIWFHPAQIATVLAMVYIGSYLVWHYFVRFRNAFSTETVFATGKDFVRFFMNDLPNAPFVKRPADLNPEAPDYKSKLAGALLQSYMLLALVSWLANRLSAILKSKKLDLYFVSALVYTLLLTCAVFVFLYLGLYAVDPMSFSGVDAPSFLDFLGLSVSALIATGISPIDPATGISQTLVYTERLAEIVLFVLLLFVFKQSMRERHQQDFDELIKDVNATATQLGSLFENNYALTLTAAEQLLIESHAQVARWLVKARIGEERAKLIPGFVVESTTPSNPIEPSKAE
jgi:hypothetical protein